MFMEFKDWLREQLLNRGYTQEEFGRAVGVSGPAVNSWLQGRSVGIDNLRKIAEVLGISKAEVFSRAGIIDKSDIQTVIQEEKDLDAEIEELCKYFQGVFLDKRGKLSLESKKVVIDVLKYVIEKEGRTTKKEQKDEK